MINKTARGVICAFMLLWLCVTAQAQQEKGDLEVLAFSGGFNIGVGDSGGFSSYSLGGRVGYFITRRHEAGGGIDLSIVRIRFRLGDETISETSVGLSLAGLYRYNFASKGSKFVPFIGMEASVATFGGFFEGAAERVRLRPHGGFKYFVKKNVALDFSFGGSFNVARDDDSFASRDAFIDGRVGLSFVF
jgi:hypothetical protein